MTTQASEVVGAASGRPITLGDASARGGTLTSRGLVSRILATADIFGVSAAFFLAEFSAGGRSRDVAFLLLSLAGALAIFGASGLYERGDLSTHHSTADALGSLIISLIVVTFAAQAATWVVPGWTPNRSVFLVFWFTACAVVPCARGIGRAFARPLVPRQKALIVGAGEIGQLYARKLLQHPEYCVDFAGFLDDQPRERRSDLLEYETRMFAPHHFARFLVKPRMTGLWQVTARARSTFREALEMDAAYAVNWSLGLDLALLVRTPLQLFRRKVTA